MKESKDFEELLKESLSPQYAPDDRLKMRIEEKWKESDNSMAVHKKKMTMIFAAALFAVAMSVSAFAAWKLLGAKQVAEKVGSKALAAAFEEDNAVKINESAVSGDYRFTLLGIVSGKGLSEFESSAPYVNPERTYAVMSIEKKEGGGMPDSQSDNYGEVPFFVSPLIKGQKPWQVNIASMNGGYGEFVENGVMYRLIECDDIQMFADRGIYLCASTTNFYDINAYSYDEVTGEIAPKDDFEGSNALFTLPLDAGKANHEKADKYLDELLGEHEEEPVEDEVQDTGSEEVKEIQILQKDLPGSEGQASGN